MAKQVTVDEAEQLMERLFSSRPKSFFKHVDDGSEGIGCVMHYLAAKDEPATAGEISEYMKVSTARVAVLLRKMSAKGLIKRSPSKHDARKALISLSDKGREKEAQIKAETLDLLCKVVNKVGIERFEEFIRLSFEIKEAVDEITDKENE